MFSKRGWKKIGCRACLFCFRIIIRNGGEHSLCDKFDFDSKFSHCSVELRASILNIFNKFTSSQEKQVNSIGRTEYSEAEAVIEKSAKKGTKRKKWIWRAFYSACAYAATTLVRMSRQILHEIRSRVNGKPQWTFLEPVSCKRKRCARMEPTFFGTVLV